MNVRKSADITYYTVRIFLVLFFFFFTFRTVPGEQLPGGPVHTVAVGQHPHPRAAVDEPGRFRGGPGRPVRRRPGTVQLARLRPEPQLPGLLQAEQQARAAGDGRRQGVDVQDTVRAVRRPARRRPGG